MDASARKIRLGALTAGLTIVVMALGAEVLLRAAGKQPWRPLWTDAGHPVIFQPDPVLGWRHLPGDHRFPPFAETGPEVEMRLLADGSRFSGKELDARGGSLVLVGGSLTEGFAISDPETFAWKLQERFPALHVENLGHGAFGTYQSLLMLEERLARDPLPRLVAYGFYYAHEIRNVATAEWLRLLALADRRHRSVGVPFATLDAAGRIQRHPPEPYPRWPLRERSAAVTFLQHLYAQLRTRDRATQATEVTMRLILEMRSACESRGVPFVVVILSASPEKHTQYAQFLARTQTDLIDCSHPLAPAYVVRGDGHPNGWLNSIWADCLEHGLRRRLARSAGPGGPDGPG